MRPAARATDVRAVTRARREASVPGSSGGRAAALPGGGQAVPGALGDQLQGVTLIEPEPAVSSHASHDRFLQRISESPGQAFLSEKSRFPAAGNPGLATIRMTVWREGAAWDHVRPLSLAFRSFRPKVGRRSPVTGKGGPLLDGFSIQIVENRHFVDRILEFLHSLPIPVISMP